SWVGSWVEFLECPLGGVLSFVTRPVHRGERTNLGTESGVQNVGVLGEAKTIQVGCTFLRECKGDQIAFLPFLIPVNSLVINFFIRSWNSQGHDTRLQIVRIMNRQENFVCIGENTMLRPHRNPMPPPKLAADAPVPNAAHPMIVNLRPALRMKPHWGERGRLARTGRRLAERNPRVR